LGLQHAHERGLVHRDIKPSNLLLAAGVVKLLDLGLVRLAHTAEGADSASTLTEEGWVVGTPDYLAPEQASDPRKADIRSDLYSLGCTFYFLLAGRPPFPYGSPTDKVIKHAMLEPQALAQLRPDVPPAVAVVVRRLLAKRPEERFQTPAELAAALAASALDPPAPVLRQEEYRSAAGDTEPGWSSLEDSAPPVVQAPRTAGRRHWPWLAAAGGGLVVVLVCSATRVTNLAPVKGMPLTTLTCASTGIKNLAPLEGKPLRNLECAQTQIVDLAPLKGMPLHYFGCSGTKVSDLTPLRNMPLSYLDICGTSVADLSPLRGMPVGILNCGVTRVPDLSPLRGMPLTKLYLNNTPVGDLEPLRGMRLEALYCNSTAVKELSPLEGMPLRQLWCDIRTRRDLELLRSLKALELLNERPAADVLKEAAAWPLP
jgi:hypothetical protein